MTGRSGPPRDKEGGLERAVCDGSDAGEGSVQLTGEEEETEDETTEQEDETRGDLPLSPRTSWAMLLFRRRGGGPGLPPASTPPSAVTSTTARGLAITHCFRFLLCSTTTTVTTATSVSTTTTSTT